MKTWHAHLRRTVKLIEFTYEDCNAFFCNCKREENEKGTRDILAPRLSARHKCYVCVKDAGKRGRYVALSVLGIFYSFSYFCDNYY